MKLERKFFERPTLEVARDLLGKYIVFGDKEGRITEVEAYVYLIYGMYHCLNFVTEREGFPAAVLIRGVDWVSGPGKLCREFGITREHNGLDLCAGRDFFVEDRGDVCEMIKETPRIGIKVGTDKLWRFVID